MSFLDEVKDFLATLRRLAGHWRVLGALVVLLGFGALYLNKKVLPAPPPAATVKGAADADKAAPGKTGPAEEGKNDAATPSAGADSPVESIASQMVDVAARPVLMLKGTAKWDDLAKALAAAIAKVNAAAAKAGLLANGHALAVFTDYDNENTFKYQAMLPIAKAPDGKAKLDDGVEVGASPAGKALKFEHRGSYDEIDATYEAIAAYLDEKGLDSQNLLIEEYLTNFTEGEDANMDVDIYVFVK